MNKRLISILVTMIILSTCIVLGVNAENENPEFVFCVDGVEYTVQFLETDLSAFQQELVAAQLVGADAHIAELIGGDDLENIWCDLFGHDFTVSSVSVVEHKVRATQPRCIKRIYDVSVCNRCDYTESVLVTSYYIYCCD